MTIKQEEIEDKIRKEYIGRIRKIFEPKINRGLIKRLNPLNNIDSEIQWLILQMKKK